METITIVLLLLLAVIRSGIFSRIVPLPLPRPLFRIALGAVIGVVVDWRGTLDPEIFFLRFLPPLLFLDGWCIAGEELFKEGKLALGLVVFTVVDMGFFFINGMIPAMPLALRSGPSARKSSEWCAGDNSAAKPRARSGANST